MSAVDYADAVEHRAGEILAEGTPVGYPVPVAVTWMVAIDGLDDPVAVLLLRLWAFFGPEPIPTDLIGSDAVPILPPGLATLAGNPLARGRVITRITRLGLVRLVGSDVVMHRLVQTVLRDHTPPHREGQDPRDGARCACRRRPGRPGRPDSLGAVRHAVPARTRHQHGRQRQRKRPHPR
jgi:hypothetical protein